MIIDKILDRKAGDAYEPRHFYIDCIEYGPVGEQIAAAMDGGSEEDVKEAICKYIIDNEYNPEICDYVNSVEWLKAESEKNTYIITVTENRETDVVVKASNAEEAWQKTEEDWKAGKIKFGENVRLALSREVPCDVNHDNTFDFKRDCKHTNYEIACGINNLSDSDFIEVFAELGILNGGKTLGETVKWLGDVIEEIRMAQCEEA